MFEKETVIETCNRYDVAPPEAFQVNVGFIGTPVDPSAGDASNGAARVVINRRTLDQSLVPLAFDALTRQKYAVLNESPLTVKVRFVIPLWLTTVVEKDELVETCN